MDKFRSTHFMAIEAPQRENTAPMRPVFMVCALEPIEFAPMMSAFIVRGSELESLIELLKLILEAGK